MKTRRDLFLVLFVLFILTLSGMCVLWTVARVYAGPSVLDRTVTALILTAILCVGTVGAVVVVLVASRRDEVVDSEDLFP